MLNLIAPNETQEPGIGHNSEASTNWEEMLDPGALRMALAMDYEKLSATQKKLLKSYENFLTDHPKGVETDSQAQLATDLGKQLKDYAKKVESKRTEVKKPFDEAASTVQRFFRAIGEPLETGGKALERLISAHTAAKARAAQAAAAEAARVAREEAEQAAAMAAATMHPEVLDEAVALQEQAHKAEKLAAAPIAQHSRMRGDFAVSSGRTTYSFTVEDAALVPREYLMIDEAKIKRAINGADRVTAIPGIAIAEEFKTTIR